MILLSVFFLFIYFFLYSTPWLIFILFLKLLSLYLSSTLLPPIIIPFIFVHMRVVFSSEYSLSTPIIKIIHSFICFSFVYVSNRFFFQGAHKQSAKKRYFFKSKYHCFISFFLHKLVWFSSVITTNTYIHIIAKPASYKKTRKDEDFLIRF